MIFIASRRRVWLLPRTDQRIDIGLDRGVGARVQNLATDDARDHRGLGARDELTSLHKTRQTPETEKESRLSGQWRTFCLSAPMAFYCALLHWRAVLSDNEREWILRLVLCEFVDDDVEFFIHLMLLQISQDSRLLLTRLRISGRHGGKRKEERTHTTYTSNMYRRACKIRLHLSASQSRAVGVGPAPAPWRIRNGGADRLTPDTTPPDATSRRTDSTLLVRFPLCLWLSSVFCLTLVACKNGRRRAAAAAPEATSPRQPHTHTGTTHRTQIAPPPLD